MPQYDPVDPDELLYRRISLKSNWVSGNGAVRQVAFLPHKGRDIDGISIIRANYRSAEETACPLTTRHREYVVAVVRAGDLMNLGLTLDVTPDDIDKQRGGIPAHVSIREMNAQTYRDDNVVDWARQIAEKFVINVLGPFDDEEN